MSTLESNYIRKRSMSKGPKKPDVPSVLNDAEICILLQCSCNEKVVTKNGKEVILKSRILKIVDGLVWAKCKRCGRWLSVSFPISEPDCSDTSSIEYFI